MEQALELREEGQLTVADVKAQVNLIQQVMKEVMIKDTHYGIVPGCGDKPSLLKPGAEKIMSTFRLVPEIHKEDLSSSDERRYSIIVNLLNYQGVFVGSGIGECSSDEDKYKWRKAFNNKEFESTLEDRRREKWKKGKYNKPDYQVKQIRTNIADVANTVLKMAKKRALVDAVLTATAASDIFTQDLDDMPTEIVNGGNKPAAGKPEVKPPESKSANTADGDEDVALRAKLEGILNDLKSDGESISDLVYKYSSFTNKEKKEIPGRDSIDKLNGKWLKSTYGKAKEAWEAAGFNQPKKDPLDDIPEWTDEEIPQ